MAHNKPADEDGMDEAEGKYDDIRDFKLDPSGYFLIRVDCGNNNIEAGFCKSANKVLVKITGKKPQDIYFEAAKRNLLSLPEHYAYLGKECEKAYIALQLGLEYVQDDELNFDELVRL